MQLGFGFESFKLHNLLLNLGFGAYVAFGAAGSWLDAEEFAACGLELGTSRLKGKFSVWDAGFKA